MYVFLKDGKYIISKNMIADAELIMSNVSNLKASRFIDKMNETLIKSGKAVVPDTKKEKKKKKKKDKKKDSLNDKLLEDLLLK